MIDQKQTNNLCLRWKGKQRRIGITGGIASGKTIIGDFLFQAKQWPILDADLYAHEALSAESEIVKKVWLRYGSKIIKNSSKNDQIINRKALAKIVFQNELEKKWLEGIIHPFVNKRIEEELEKSKSNSIVILIIPLLFEKNYTGLCSEICYIDCPRSMQLKRLQSRDNLSIKEANQRIDAQWANSLKKQFADHIINNSNDDETWKLQLKKLYKF
ncbi:dephospho-CoA kinase [Prochlorococcus marinus str. NATL2A]|uniref:Dephospho-CoA kinase n=1 Tax=Prochlorococcus marinus (strain NATL2A) TaxID=59920 RepID=COAE_PROMT|nr:dephospho-CoA kinase [Prochlorococcus marinus]Q46I08.1 RecName: Full=Dephospho-CoA kinase; AltName: Full=Dephosphocoenzyme A kinase [Prochlorococcus marinus str. NATL2A]AAZ58870.1 dephospho-CoA kinase [Prochlorococcus marinus str. NATL2A]